MFVASCNWQWWSKNIFNPSYIPCLYVFIICYLKFIEVEKLLSSFPLLALELAATISKRKICCNKKIFKAICNNKDLYSVIIWKKKLLLCPCLCSIENALACQRLYVCCISLCLSCCVTFWDCEKTPLVILFMILTKKL